MPNNQTGTHMGRESVEFLDEWQEVSLTSVADIRFSNVNKVSQPGEEPVRLCNYTDVYKNDYVTADMDFMRATATRSEIERFGLQVRDVIITKDSETPDDIGIPTVVDTTEPNLLCGYHLALIRPKQDLVDPTFLTKQLAHHRIARYFGQQANGTTRYGLSTAAIANAPLQLPMLENQRSAGAMMRLVDALITKTEAVIGKLKQVRAGMLHDLLSYGLDEHGRLRDPVARPEQFKDSPLGRIPTEWDVFELQQLFDLKTGATPSRQQEKRFFSGGNIPWAKTLDLNENWIVETDERITKDALLETSCRLLPTQTVLIAMYGGWEQIGRTGILGVPATTNQAICALICKSETNSPEYIFRSLQHGRFRWRRFAASTRKDPNISKGDVGQFLVAIPTNRQEQDEICRLLAFSDKQIRSNKKELKKLDNIKLGLQDDLLTGRVRVPETMMEGAARL